MDKNTGLKTELYCTIVRCWAQQKGELSWLLHLEILVARTPRRSKPAGESYVEKNKIVQQQLFSLVYIWLWENVNIPWKSR